MKWLARLFRRRPVRVSIPGDGDMGAWVVGGRTTQIRPTPESQRFH